VNNAKQDANAQIFWRFRFGRHREAEMKEKL